MSDLIGTSRTWVLYILAFATVSFGAVAHAQKQPDQTAKFDTFYTAGKYADAEEYARGVLSRQTSPSGKATWMHNVAMALDGEGKYRDAEPLYRQSLSILEQSLGKDHTNVALSLSNLANTLSNLNKYDEAEQMYKRAIAIRQKAGGADNPELLADYAGLAAVCFARGHYADAEPLYERCLAIVRKVAGPEDALVAAMLSNQTALYLAQGKYERAEQVGRQALAIRQKRLGRDHPEVAQSLNNLAALYTEQGRNAEAVRLFGQALMIERKTLPPQHPDIGATLNNLASLYLSQGRREDAAKLAEQAADIFRAAGGDHSAKCAVALTQLADAKRRSGEFPAAESTYRQALAIQEKVTGEHHAATGELLCNLSMCVAAQDRLAEAEDLQNRGMRTLETALGPNHPKLATAMNHVLLSRLLSKQPAGCIELATRAIQIGESSAVGPETLALSHKFRAEARWQAGQKEEALVDLLQAIDQVDQQRRFAIGAEHDQAETLEAATDVYGQAVDWLAELGRTAEAFAIAERGRARSLLMQMELNGIDLLGGLPGNEAQSLREREAQARRKMASLRSYYQSLAEQPADADRDKEVPQVLASLSRAQAAYLEAYRSIRNASPIYRTALAKDHQPVNLAELQQYLERSQGVLWEYLVDAEQVYLFIVSATAEPQLIRLSVPDQLADRLHVPAGPLTADALTQLLTWEGQPLVKAFTTAAPANDLVERLSGLFDVLVPDNAREALASEAVHHVIIVPDGPLHDLPFETLVTGAGDSPRYLLDAGPAIAYAPSATTLVNLAQSRTGTVRQGTQELLTVADPMYGVSGVQGRADPNALTARSRYSAVGGHLEQLPYSGRESRWVADVFKKYGVAAARLEKNLATEAALRANSAQREWLHLACHGVAENEAGNAFGALALTPGKQPSNPADDGFLTLTEIYDLNLKSCELAILSACQTNYGPHYQGEGSWALSRGFLVAGARRVVASNWLVDDEAAASLVSYFCSDVAKHLKAGDVDYSRALHDAKAWVRSQEKWSSPYYWGTFVLVGPN